MKAFPTLLLGALLALTGLCSSAYADGADTSQLHLSTSKPWWVTVGMGMGTGGSNSARKISGLSTLLGWHYQLSENSLLSLRNYYQSDTAGAFGGDMGCAIIGGAANTCDVDEGYMADFGVLYGLIGHNRHGYLSASTGLAIVRGTDTVVKQNGTEDSKHKFTTVGLPLEAHAVWTPIRFVGLGMALAGNLNTKKSSGAAFLTLELGDFGNS